MCGIAVIINLDFKPIDFSALKNMADIQHHRGPDNQGFAGFCFQKEILNPVQSNNVQSSNIFHGGLGFNRLSILDLSENGHQPMISANQKIAIVYNGETYNAFEFKPGLEKKGYRFKSTSDTEIILYLYQEYGIEKLLNMANGMFGFAIVDLTNKKVYLARDHAGIKPLYWYKKGNTVLFASEIKSFLQHPLFIPEIEEENIDEQIFYRYTAFDRTLFKNVKQVPPAHYVEISETGIYIRKYWEPEFTNSFVEKKLALGKLENVLKNSVQSQLISDVKVGCQLSGGIDSSLVATFARSHFSANMDTFSVILENKKYSEEKYINQVIEKTKPIAHKIQMGSSYFASNFQRAIWHLDFPLPIPQTVGLKCLAENATQFVTVLLSGEGSDELMGGYVQHYYQAFRAKNNAILPLMAKIPWKGKKIKNQYLPGILAEDYFHTFRASISYYEFLKFMPQANLEKIFGQRRMLYPKHSNLIYKTRYYDMKTWLPAILNMQDKMTMAHSIENRVPFLDKNLINLVNDLPIKFFVKANHNLFKYNSANKFTKILLKQLALKYYSQDFVYRTKVGFNQPLTDYFLHNDMRNLIEDVVLPGIKNRGIFDFKKVINVWTDFSGKANNSHLNLLWTLVHFELWAQIFIDVKRSV